jgi:hypothetical protein
MRKLLLITFLLFLPFLGEAQTWRYVRHEVSLGVGVSNFLGDLGGARGIGTHYFKDIKVKSTRPSLMGSYKFMISPAFSIKGSVIWGYLHGDDAITRNDIRSNRNLSFKTMLGEFSAICEFYPLGERVSPRYKVSGVHGNATFTIMPYIYLGVGLSLFNPKASINGDWLELQPLGTEGQGIGYNPAKYDRYTMVFPAGVGGKYMIDKKWSLSFDLSVRYTLSDYIDDVSTIYYDPVALDAAYGPDAAALSNRSIIQDGNAGIADLGNGLIEYKQRGNPNNKDAYMFAIFSVNYRIIKGATYIPKF